MLKKDKSTDDDNEVITPIKYSFEGTTWKVVNISPIPDHKKDFTDTFYIEFSKGNKMYFAIKYDFDIWNVFDSDSIVSLNDQSFQLMYGTFFTGPTSRLGESMQYDFIDKNTLRMSSRDRVTYILEKVNITIKDKVNPIPYPLENSTWYVSEQKSKTKL